MRRSGEGGGSPNSHLSRVGHMLQLGCCSMLNADRRRRHLKSTIAMDSDSRVSVTQSNPIPIPSPEAL